MTGAREFNANIADDLPGTIAENHESIAQEDGLRNAVGNEEDRGAGPIPDT